MITSKALARKIFAPILATLMVAGLSTGLASPAKAAGTKEVTIHYQKIGAKKFNDYNNLDLYLWAGLSGDFAPNGNDSYGKIWTLAVDSSVNQLEGLIKTGWSGVWNNKDGGDNANRQIALNASGSTEVWLVSGKQGSNVYSSVEDAVTNGGAKAGALESTGVDPNYSCTDNVCTPNAARVVTIHYQKIGASSFADYKFIDMYFWTGLNGDFGPSGSDSFGKIWTIYAPLSAGNTLEGLVKTGWDDWNHKDGGENANRSFSINASGNTEFWLVSDDGTGANTGTKVFSSVEDAVTNGGATAGAFTSTGDDPNFSCDVNNICTPFVSMPATQNVTIHFQIPAATGFASYKKLRVQDGLQETNSVFTSSDGWGKVFEKTLTNASKKLSYSFGITENGWSNKQACAKCGGFSPKADRSITLDPSGSTEVWVVAGADEMYYSSKADAIAAGAVSSSPWTSGATDPYIISTNGVLSPAPLYPSDQTLIVHWHRSDNDYTNWQVWNWGSANSADNAKDGEDQLFTGSDAFGQVFTQHLTGDQGNTGALNFLFRDSNTWATKKQQTRDWSASVAEGRGYASTTEVWVIDNEETVYYANPFPVPAAPVASPASASYGQAVTLSGTGLTGASVTLVQTAVPAVPAVPAVTASKAPGSSVYKCGSTTRSSGYVCTAAVPAKSAIPAATATAVARVISPTKVVIAFPSPAAALTGKLVVNNPAGSATSGGNFTLTKTKVGPTISSTTTKGLVGDTITVTGTNVGAATAVKLGSLVISDFTVTDINSLTFKAPVGTVDSKVAVTTAGGTVNAPSNFALIPSITSVSPATVAIGGRVTVTGVNLGAVSSVKLGTKSITSFTKGATTVTFTVPSGSATGTVALTAAGGSVTSVDSVTVLPQPTVTSVSGTKVGTKFKKGATLTVTGTNFTGATSLKIGASLVSGFVVVNSTTITFTAPSNKSGVVTVTTPGGSVSTTSSIATTVS